MSTFCGICLRSKSKIRSINNESLMNFYDDLCDYVSGSRTKFCSECLYKLKKCFEFKKYCRLAADKLKTWARQPKDQKKPKHLLYTEMPEAQLSLCNKNNYKIYFYQTEDVDVAAPIQISSSRNPHIVTVNIPADSAQIQDSIKELSQCSLENCNENVEQEQEIKEEFVDFTENDNELDMVTVETKNALEIRRKLSEELGTEHDLTDSGSISDRAQSPDKDDSDCSSSDESLKEVERMLKRLDKQELENAEKPIKHKRKLIIEDLRTFDIKDLRTMLKERFMRCEPVKDEDGNIIDRDAVLNNLDMIQDLGVLRRLCLGPGPFSPLDIRKLAKLHKRFSNDDTAPYTKVFLATQAEILAEFEKRRQNINYTRYAHRCELCLMGFTERWFLDYHSKSSHNPDLLFECSICQIRTTTKKLLSAHMCMHKRVLKCKQCTFTSGKKDIMINHVNRHNGVKYPCEHCGKSFNNWSSLAAHLRIHAARNICELCGDAFDTQKGIQFHKLKKHAGEVFVQDKDNTKCQECDILFISSKVYNKHVRRIHKEPKETTKLLFTCRLCEWKGPARALLNAHYRTEHPEALPSKSEPQKKYNLKRYYFLCHDCGKRFRMLSVYKDHMNMHSGAKPYACNKCPKTFSSRIGLHTHGMTHEAPTKECSQCGKKFSTDGALHVHRQRHLPPSRECPHCRKMFTTNIDLKAHLKVHGFRDRRFECHICDKVFLSNSSLKEHVAGVHNNQKRKR